MKIPPLIHLPHLNHHERPEHGDGTLRKKPHRPARAARWGRNREEAERNSILSRLYSERNQEKGAIWTGRSRPGKAQEG